MVERGRRRAADGRSDLRRARAGRGRIRHCVPVPAAAPEQTTRRESANYDDLRIIIIKKKKKNNENTVRDGRTNARPSIRYFYCVAVKTRSSLRIVVRHKRIIRAYDTVLCRYYLYCRSREQKKKNARVRALHVVARLCRRPFELIV